MGEVLYIKRVATDKVPLQVVNVLLDVLVPVELGVGLAPALDTFIRLHLHEEPVLSAYHTHAAAHREHEESLHIGNLHHILLLRLVLNATLV